MDGEPGTEEGDNLVGIAPDAYPSAARRLSTQKTLLRPPTYRSTPCRISVSLPVLSVCLYASGAFQETDKLNSDKRIASMGRPVQAIRIRVPRSRHAKSILRQAAATLTFVRRRRKIVKA